MTVCIMVSLIFTDQTEPRVFGVYSSGTDTYLTSAHALSSLYYATGPIGNDRSLAIQMACLGCFCHHRTNVVKCSD